MPGRHGGLRLGTLLGARTFSDGPRGQADPAIYVKPYVKRSKNDAADASAIEPRPCRGEAMRFVPVKSEAQQATRELHKRRELLIKQRR